MGESILSSMPDDRSYAEFTEHEHLQEHAYEGTGRTLKIKPKPGKCYPDSTLTSPQPLLPNQH